MSTLFWLVPAVLAAACLVYGARVGDWVGTVVWFLCIWGTGLVLLVAAAWLGWWTP